MIQKHLKYGASYITDSQLSTALRAASGWGSWNSINVLIDAGAKVNKTSLSRHTPLAYACEEGFPKTAAALLAGGADANAVCSHGTDTILWYSAYLNPNVDCVQEMLIYGADPNHHLFDPPLLIQIALSDFDTACFIPICNALFNGKRPIKLDATDADGWTALIVASSKGKLDLVQWLLKSGADIDRLNRHNYSALALAASKGHVEIVAALLKKGAQINVAPRPPLIYAVSYPDILRLLLDSGADVNAVDPLGNTAINSASQGGIIDSVKMLVEKGADVNHKNQYGWSPIFYVVCPHSSALTRLLAENGAKMDDVVEGQTLLHMAIGEDLELLKTLLEFRKVININAVNSHGYTALHYAIFESNIEYLKILIRAGADVNTQCPDGTTPLHIAAEDPNRLGHLKLLLADEDVLKIDAITRMLVFNPTKPADVKQTVRGGTFYTALAAACLSASPATIKFLIDEGASVRLADEISGRLPHHFAAANGFDNFQAIILSYQGDIMVSDKEQKNCLHWAAQFGNLKVVESITSRLSSEGTLARYINQPDSHGWTPLCWAARPHDRGWARKMRSEQPDFAGVVKALLLNGAQRDVKCTLGNGTITEELTPLELARRCDAGRDIINMLQYGRRYTHSIQLLLAMSALIQ
ncbi:hypothetical protein ONZ43_g3450 [Nemania bipapillata]|uniref:Uncharacterized protein n=1 Tax=Nemania bipapillata TaxID=110536 RepID=A0ACC2IWP4_9PEZI|nr:hypothetical protein ONZ43_g3450 [Nemania bipapillata]